MKITIIGNDGTLPLPLEGYGGIERVQILLAKEFSKKFEAELIWGGKEESEETKGKLCTRIIATEKIPAKYRAFSRPRAAFFAKNASTLADPQSVIHLHHAWNANGFCFPKKSFPKIAFTVHNPYRPRVPSFFAGLHPAHASQSLFSDQLQAWFALKNSNATTFVSSAAKKFVHEHASFKKTLFEGKPEAVIPNCVELPKNPKISDNGFALFVGRVEKIKGVQTLLEAFSNLPKNKLAIAGPLSQSPEKKEIQALAKKLALKNAEFIDSPNSKQLNALYANCSFAIIPSVFPEPFGLPVLEAWSYKKPAIVSTAGALPEIVETGKTGLIFPASNANALASACETLFNDGKLRQKLGAAGFTQAKEKYSPKKVAAQYLEFFEKSF